MCGVVGFVGPAQATDRPLAVALQGLGRLEYRGYDSAGVALTGPGGLQVRKKAGELKNLIAAIEQDPLDAATTAISWSTSGSE